MIINDKLVGLIIRWCGVRLPGGPPKIEKPLFAVAFFYVLELEHRVGKVEGLLAQSAHKNPGWQLSQCFIATKNVVIYSIASYYAP